MARIRSVKPDFWTDEKVVDLSPFARLLFIGLWNFADDEGRMEYSPKRLKMQIFPADSLDISELVGELRGKSMVTTYVIDGIEYLQVVNFGKHQKIDKRVKSKFPAPPISAELLRFTPNPADSPRIPPTPAELPRVSPTEGNGMEGNGKERSKSTSTAPNASHSPLKQNGHRIEFDPESGAFKGISEEQELRWQEAYPAVPIPPAIAQAAAWLKANPANKKKNNERFLVNWFSRAQERAARVRQ